MGEVPEGVLREGRALGRAGLPSCTTLRGTSAQHRRRIPHATLAEKLDPRAYRADRRPIARSRDAGAARADGPRPALGISDAIRSGIGTRAAWRSLAMPPIRCNHGAGRLAIGTPLTRQIGPCRPATAPNFRRYRPRFPHGPRAADRARSGLLPRRGIARRAQRHDRGGWSPDHMFRCLAWLYDGFARPTGVALS